MSPLDALLPSSRSSNVTPYMALCTSFHTSTKDPASSPRSRSSDATVFPSLTLSHRQALQLYFPAQFESRSRSYHIHAKADLKRCRRLLLNLEPWILDLTSRLSATWMFKGKALPIPETICVSDICGPVGLILRCRHRSAQTSQARLSCRNRPHDNSLSRFLTAFSQDSSRRRRQLRYYPQDNTSLNLPSRWHHQQRHQHLCRHHPLPLPQPPTAC